MNKHLHHYKRILALLLSLVMLASVPMQTMAESAQISLENETAESEIGHSHESEDQALTESEDLTDTDTISDVSETDVEEIPDETFVDEAEEETSIDETVEEVSVDETIEEESVTETEDNENVILSSGKHFCCYCDEWKDDSDFSFCGNANDDSFCTDCLQGWGIHCEDCDKCKYDDEDDFCIMCHKCRDCWDEDEHCSECNRETDLVCEDCGKCYDCVTADRCYECHLCPDCWDEDEHCKTCKSHGDVCSSCGRCEECVESHHYHCSLCDGCLKGGEVEYCNTCGDTNDDDVHCQKCIEGTDECCNNCGLHMLSDKTSFICSEYNYCGECALIEGIHCPNCIEAHVECEDCGLCENCIEELETEAIHQDNGKTDLLLFLAVRAMLDKCATVDECIALLENYDIHTQFDTPFHLLISDTSGKSVVVEWIDNQMNVLDHNYCTNFQLSEGKDYWVGIGQDRYETVEQKLKETDNVLSPEDAMGLLSDTRIEWNGEWDTEWSVVYNQSDFSVNVCIGMDYEHVYCISIDYFK